MILSQIQSHIADFKKTLHKGELSDIDWLYQKQTILHEEDAFKQWPLNQWLTTLFSSPVSTWIWKKDERRSGELMLAMATYDEEMTKTAFRELFAEERALDGRIDRFKFYAEELIGRMKFNTDFRETWHHQDNSIISYYLMMRFPERYAYYTPNLHQLAVEQMGAKPLDEIEDMARFQKMVRTLSNFLWKDEELIQLHLDRFQTPIVVESRLLVNELIAPKDGLLSTI